MHFFLFIKIVIYFIISFICTWIFILRGPDSFFHYFLYRFQGLFFVTDSNILVSLFIQIITFFSWCFFFPFFLFAVFFYFFSSFTVSEQIKFYNFTWIVIYSLIFSYIVNEYDYSFISVNIKELRGEDFYIEMTDFSSYIKQYLGLFWDLFNFIFIYFSLFYVILEINIIYKYIIFTNSYWWNSDFLYKSILWVYRVALFFIFYYFFGGDGHFFFFSINTLIIIELQIILFRFFLRLRSYNYSI